MFKKLICIFVLFLFTTNAVYADDNKIYFTENDGRIYYQDYDYTFMNHPDMVPGSEYTDTLLLENETNIEYGLYVKLKKINDTVESNELFDSINMKIYIDGNLIYEGSSRGLTVVDGESVLTDVIKLVDMKPNTSHNLTVKTQLSKDYSNTNYSDTSYVNWVFYASYGEQTPPDEQKDDSDNSNLPDIDKNNITDDKDLEEITKVPQTQDNILSVLVIFLFSLFSLAIIIFMKKKIKQVEE